MRRATAQLARDTNVSLKYLQTNPAHTWHLISLLGLDSDCPRPVPRPRLLSLPPASFCAAHAPDTSHDTACLCWRDLSRSINNCASVFLVKVAAYFLLPHPFPVYVELSGEENYRLIPVQNSTLPFSCEIFRHFVVSRTVATPLPPPPSI